MRRIRRTRLNTRAVLVIRVLAPSSVVAMAFSRPLTVEAEIDSSAVHSVGATATDGALCVVRTFQR